MTIAAGHGLLYLFPLQMVFHGTGVAVAVKKNGSVRPYPGDTVALGVKAFEIGRSVFLHAPGGKPSLYSQLVLLHLGKIVVKDAHNQGDRGKKYRKGDQTDGAKYSFCH